MAHETHRLVESRNRSVAFAPHTMAAVVKAFASTQFAPVADTRVQYAGEQAPVDGSMMWWTVSDPTLHLRTLVLELASPPRRMATT